MTSQTGQSQPALPAPTSAPAPPRWGRLLRWILPFLVSALLLLWLLSGMDLGVIRELLTVEVAWTFIPLLLAFIAISLLIEAICLVWVVSYYHEFSSYVMAARIKAASYLLGLINYALGAGAVALLLHRRSGVPLGQAAGSVILIGLFDMGSLLILALAALGLRESDGASLNAGFTALAALALFLGFAVLRAPVSLGPLDRLRNLPLFEAARTLPLNLLLRLGLLRVAFVASFIILTGGALDAFGVEISPLPLIVGVCALLLISAIPMAAAGLGTGQIAFVAIFEGYGTPEVLLATSLTISFGMIICRALIGLAFAREFTAEAFRARREIAQ
ncbi:MAG: lysylphosphatidylglycerol synthase domain-containing protein [Myxococcota bacterium]|nr:lysylphosphatidylglycerol synthase domain-containing protein [Myxococcota bacterium]